MRKPLLLLLAATFAVALAAGTAVAGNGPGTCTGVNCPGNPDCPDADGDGICNGQDPDYTPGANPACPDADGDGICNCVDPDWTGPTGQRRDRACRYDAGDGTCAGPGAGQRARMRMGWQLGQLVRAMFGPV